MHILQRLPFPIDTSDKELLSMYVRSDQSITIDPNSELYSLKELSVIDFSTYFGAFSLTTWCSKTGIDNVTVRIKMSGTTRIRMIHLRPDGTKDVMAEVFSRKTLKEDLDLEWTEIVLDNILGKKGILYPEILVIEGIAFISALEFVTFQPILNFVRMAIIMPTYKRENFVYRNIEKISGVLPEYEGKMSLIIVDNGKTLCMDPPPWGVSIIPNENYGGSGGFSRGLLEALDDSGSFTHFLFCDDDIELEVETIRRTYSLWEYLDEKSVIGGALLSISKKNSICAVGGHYNSNTCSLNLRPPMSGISSSDLIGHDLNEENNYFGWWYFSFSKTVYDLVKMPLPIFVRGDDVEFGIRISKLPIQFITLLGCGVWHEDFMKKKFTPVMDFYSTRNMKIINTLNGDNALRHILFKGLEYIFNNLLLYRYAQVKIYLLSWSDFLKGPQHIMQEFRSAPNFHLSLVKNYQFEYVENCVCPIQPSSESSIKTPIFQKIMILLSLNGHLLPEVFFKKNINKVFIDYGDFKLVNIFRNKTIFYCDSNSKKAYIHHHDKKLFFNLIFQTFIITIKSILIFHVLKKRYQESFSKMTGEKYWREVLLDAESNGRRSPI